jgi:hypothetical protein
MRFGAGYESYLTMRAQQLVMLGPILLTIGKNISPEGYVGWMNRRVRAMMGTMGLENTSTIWTDTTYPAISIMSSLSTYLSSAYFLRREIFRVCWSVALGQDRFCNLFKDVISLLKGTNMTHIILIDEYLYHRYKEILSVRLLAENHKGMAAAWEFLASLEEHERSFAKILYDKEVTACLNRCNFPLHIAAAVAAAKFELPSMANYRGAEGQAQSSTRLSAIVSDYLSVRLSLIKTAIINEHAMFGSSLEVAEYHRAITNGTNLEESPATSGTTRGLPSSLAQPPARNT